MAGHSKFKNIMHRKGAQDKKRASQFAKLGRELTVAARAAGSDPDANLSKFGIRIASKPTLVFPSIEIFPLKPPVFPVCIGVKI